MSTENKPDDFAQGRILALRTTLMALIMSHPNLKTASKEVAQALSAAEGKWMGAAVSDLFIEGLLAESADLQALLSKSESLRVPNTKLKVSTPGSHVEAPPESPREDAP